MKSDTITKPQLKSQRDKLFELNRIKDVVLTCMLTGKSPDRTEIINRTERSIRLDLYIVGKDMIVVEHDRHRYERKSDVTVGNLARMVEWMKTSGYGDYSDSVNIGPAIRAVIMKWEPLLTKDEVKVG